MRYFLFLTLPKTPLACSIIEPSRSACLMFFCSTLEWCCPGILSTGTAAIPLTAITARTDNHLCTATLTGIKASCVLHRQKSRWGLDLSLQCVILEGSCFGTVFWGMTSILTHTFSQRHRVIIPKLTLCLDFWLSGNKKTANLIFSDLFLKVKKIWLA